MVKERKTDFSKYMELQIRFLKIYKALLCLRHIKIINDYEASQSWKDRGYAATYRRIFGKTFKVF